MDLLKLTTMARRLSRTNEMSTASEVIHDWLAQGLIQFAKDCQGILRETYLTLEPSFTITPGMGFNLIVVGTHAYSGVVIPAMGEGLTATEVCDVLAAAIRVSLGLPVADPAVEVEYVNRAFVVTITGSTSISISSLDATRPLYFGGGRTGVVTGDTWDGLPLASANIANEYPFCSFRAELPADFLRMVEVSYAGKALYTSTYLFNEQPNCIGTPMYYCVDDGVLYIKPVVADGTPVKVVYKSVPVGLHTDINGDVDQANPLDPLPSGYHFAVAYYAAARLSEENFEDQVAARLHSQYITEAQRYLRDYSNANSDVSFGAAPTQKNTMAVQAARS